MDHQREPDAMLAYIGQKGVDKMKELYDTGKNRLPIRW